MYDNVRYLFNVHHLTLSIQEICSGKDHTRYLLTPAPTCCRTGCSRCQYRLFMLQEQALYAVFHMASHRLAHASPRDAMWKTAGRHMGDSVSLSTLSISSMPKRYYHAHFPYRKDAFSENKS